MKTIAFLLGVPACIYLQACSKHNAVDLDPTQPTILLNFPANNQVYKTGDSVRLMGNVSDNSLHELRLKITGNTGNDLLYDTAISVHELTSYDFDQSWKSNVSEVTDATVQVEVEDHGNHTVEKKITIRINP